MDHHLISRQQNDTSSFQRRLAGDEDTCGDPVRKVNAAAERPTPSHPISTIDGFGLAPGRDHSSHGRDARGKNPLSGSGRKVSCNDGVLPAQDSRHPTRGAVDPRQRLPDLHLSDGIGFVPTHFTWTSEAEQTRLAQSLYSSSIQAAEFL